MGIRIHKILGYGLTDVVADEENWDLRNDPRFDPDGWLFSHDENEFHHEGFTTHIKEKIETTDEDDHDRFSLRMLLHTLNETKKQDFYCGDGVIHDMEYGDSNVIIFVPPGHGDWQRYDSILDYYDPTNLDEDGGIANSVININRPLWPYESYVNIKTMPPKRLTGCRFELYTSMRSLGIEKYLDPEKAFAELGVDNEEEFNKFIVPIIPIELIELIKYLKIFKNEEDIYQLRPMIYGYWG